MKRKTFKTPTGYLNSMEDQIERLKLETKRSGRAIDVEGLQRQSVNNLLSQFGFGTTAIRNDERPYVGIKRLHAAEGDVGKKKKLDEIRRWFGRQVTFLGASVTSVSVTYGGKRYTETEFQAIEALSRERGIPIDQAIAERTAASRAE